MRLLHIASALSFLSLSSAWTTYIVPHTGGNDDTTALAAAFSANPKLAANATILFAKGVTYNILTPISFPSFENVLVSIQGNLTYAADIKATQEIVGSSRYPGSWFTFNGGSNVTLEGSEDPNWGWVNSHGQQWWDLERVASQANRPRGWAFQGIENGEIRLMKLSQPVAWSFSTSGSKGLHFHNNLIMAVSENKAVPSNTDGFAAQGEEILFEDNIVFNGDDCLTVGSPAKNIHFRNSYCNGGHGLSIGSLGNGGAVANVQNVLIENVVMENSLYGARFKSWIGGNGFARNVTWKNITLKNVQTPIFLTQNYYDKGHGQESDSPTTNTLVDTFTFEGFQGTIDDHQNSHQVAGATGKEVVIFDLYPGAAKAIVAKNIHTETLSGAPVMVICNSSVTSADVGFKCQNGLFQPTALGEEA